MKRLIPSLLLMITIGCSPAADSGDTNTGIFSKDNLVAWCIVPFDANERGPYERAEMLKRLGIPKLAYDWREKHVSTFEDEIKACREHGVEFFAFWGEHPEAFALFEAYGLKPQIWLMLPSPDGYTQEEKVENAARGLLPIVEKTQAAGYKFGLYNHGDWQGEPENMVAIVEWLRAHTEADHVGIVYNQHHGHDHIERFETALALMLPYLHCLNLNGMNSTPDPKILNIGEGKHDEDLLSIVLASGYQGPIGILDHRDELDAEVALQGNLDGLSAMRERLIKASASHRD